MDYTSYIGSHFGEWTVLDYAGQKGKNRKTPYVTCQCSCGKIKDVSLYSLTGGKSKSCGHKNKNAFITNNPKPIIDEIGHKYGRLTVIKRAYKDNDTRAYWECKCDCGNTITVSGKDLRNGHTSSCGCLRKEVSRNRRLALSNIQPGNRYGKLTVIEQDKVKNHFQYWKCQCDCGNIISVAATNLNSGNTQSCGCMKSKGEEKIASILRDNNISFKQQFTFDDLLINNGKGKFDFAIIINNNLKCLIEYQGIQHYDKNNPWFIGDSDEKKREYCIKNKYSLIEIPYSDYDKLTWEYLKEKCNL